MQLTPDSGVQRETSPGLAGLSTAETSTPQRAVDTVRTNYWFLLAGLVFFAGLIAVFLLSQAAGGQTWDELLDYSGTHEQIGLTLRLLSGDLSAHFSQVSSNFAFYGILAVLPAYLAERFAYAAGVLNSFPVYTFVLHATAFACNLVTVAVSYLILLGTTRSRATAATGAALLALFPLWLGFSFLNHKDIPTACFTTLAVYASMLLLQSGENGTEPKRSAWLLSLATILMAGLKLPALALIVPAWAAALYVLWRKGHLAFLIKLCAVTALGTFLVTPVSWTDPLHFALQSVKLMARHDWNGCTLTAGSCLAPQSPDWSAATYLFKWYLAQLPVVIAAGAVLALVMAPFRGAVQMMISASLLFPLLLISLRNSTLYDGLRHVLFTIPLIFILAVMLWHEIAMRAGRRIFALAAAGLAAVFAWDNFAMFPYNYVSYNLFTRQLADADNFETDLWGFSLKEAARMPVASQSSAPVLANPAHLVWPYLEASSRMVIPLYEASGKLPPGSEVIVVSYTRRQPVPAGCSDTQFVTRQLPLGGRLLRLSFAARCKTN